jgi:circadian clock protein KaiB
VKEAGMNRRPTRTTAKERSVVDSSRSLRSLAEKPVAEQRYLLRLYVTGTTPGSVRAIQRVRQVCDERLQGRFELEVIDVYQLPALAKDDQIIATPTLVKVLPAPLRRFIGDLSRLENVLFGMDVRGRP